MSTFYIYLQNNLIQQQYHQQTVLKLVALIINIHHTQIRKLRNLVVGGKFDWLHGCKCPVDNVATYAVLFPVTVSAIVRRMFGGFISSFRILDSVASGNPLSSISSSNCHEIKNEKTSLKHQNYQ